MLAFKSIKLDTIKGIIENIENNTLADIQLEEKENKISKNTLLNIMPIYKSFILYQVYQL